MTTTTDQIRRTVASLTVAAVLLLASACGLVGSHGEDDDDAGGQATELTTAVADGAATAGSREPARRPADPDAPTEPPDPTETADPTDPVGQTNSTDRADLAADPASEPSASGAPDSSEPAADHVQLRIHWPDGWVEEPGRVRAGAQLLISMFRYVDGILAATGSAMLVGADEIDSPEMFLGADVDPASLVAGEPRMVAGNLTPRWEVTTQDGRAHVIHYPVVGADGGGVVLSFVVEAQTLPLLEHEIAAVMDSVDLD